MSITLTGIFSSKDTVTNAVEDLLASGIDREKVFVDKQHDTQVKVTIPNSIDREITEILRRHHPKEITRH